jgi:NitT/TauT family transport system substrate-binding protein
VRRPIGVLVAAVLLVILVAPGPLQAQGQKIKITIPAAAVTFAPLYHAKTAGYFAEEGLDVEIITVAGGGSLQAVIARDAQFMVGPSTYQIEAYQKGQKLVSTMSLLTRNAINVVMHKDVARERGLTDKTPLADKIKALKGLRLSGVAVGSFSYEMLTYYLLKAGLDPRRDVELIGIGAGPPMVLALEQRKVDGFATGSPIPEAAVMRGVGVMIVDNSAGEDPDFSEFMMISVVVHPEWARQNADTVRKALRALLRANAWVIDNTPEAAIPSMKPFLGRLDDKILLAGLSKVRLGVPRDGRITERAVASTQDFLRKIGQLKAPIPYGELVTNEYLPK